jgi:HEAT repeat protein
MSDDQHLRKCQTDPRSTGELIQLVLSLDDEDESYYEPLWVLHSRGTPEVLAAAQALCLSSVPKERQVGADILGKLGDSARMLREARARKAEASPAGEPSLMKKSDDDTIRQLSDVIGEAREYPQEAISSLLPMVDVECNEHVLYSVIHALGHYTQHDRAVITSLVSLTAHSSAKIRHAVAMSLGESDDPLAIKALIVLSADIDSLVRDWATFALAQLIDTDTHEIREALAARVIDEDSDVRGEALYGLTVRGDERVVEALITENQLIHHPDNLGMVLCEAGKRFCDARLLPMLLKENNREETLYRAVGMSEKDIAECLDDVRAAIDCCTKNR